MSNPCASFPSFVLNAMSSTVASFTPASHASLWCESWRSVPFSSAKISPGCVAVPASTAILPSLTEREAAGDAASGQQRLHGAAGRRDPADVLRAIVGVEKDDRFSVGAELRRRDRTVERGCEKVRRTAAHVHHRELLFVVGEEPRFAALEIRDGLAVGAPRERPVVRAVERGETPRRRAGSRVDDEDVGVVRAVRVDALRPRARERDRLSVRRPRRMRFLERAGRDQRRFLGGDVEHVEMRARRIEVAVVVVLEVVSVDDDRLGFRVRRIGRVERRAHDQRDALAVRRPRVVVDAIFQLSDALRFTAATVEQPELRAFAAFARREERQVFPVRTPARRGLGVRRRRQLNALRAVPARHPDIGIRFVFRRVERGDGVGDPLTVGRDLRARRRCAAGTCRRRGRRASPWPARRVRTWSRSRGSRSSRWRWRVGA